MRIGQVRANRASSTTRARWSPDGPEGVLHAKALVVDDELALVTSANLTEAALDRNIEMGVLVRDRAFAGAVAAHFRSLIERQLLLPLPAE